MFKALQLRYKLLICYSIIYVLSISVGSIFGYVFIRENLKRNIESELNNTTNAIMNLVQTSMAVSIKNHLRAVAEKNRDLIDYYYRQFQQGILTQEAAKASAADLILNQKIGESGYTYCMDSKGIVRVHPQRKLLNTDVSSFAFVQEQLKFKEGYIEYNWKNPGETLMRPKALYMVYFEPWDWIISVSTYRKEFKHLINIDDFRKAVLEMHSGPSGYAFVIDNEGTAVIHPKLQGVNVLKAKDLPNEFLEEMRRRKSGKIIYPWQNPDEASPRRKLVIFNHIKEYDWVVASSSYLDEFYKPLKTIRNLIIAMVLTALGLVLPITFKISASITNPLRELMIKLSSVQNVKLFKFDPSGSRDEVGQLTDYFNHFINQLETYHNDLTKEINVRRRVEADLRESEARYRSVMEAAPDPIVVYDMQGRVAYFNPAFTRFFGWTLDACIGKKMDHFVPSENWHETNQMIQAVLAGETFTAVSTCRYSKAGNILHVSNSGAPYRDHLGNLAGCVVILRDITKSTLLRRQLMDISDHERQKIGQDLHDDLCPHLIGIHGLSSVLLANLGDASSPNAGLSEKITKLIGEAVEKTRGLSRGLCPVHMVSHGLETALKDLAHHTESISGIRCRFTCDGKVGYPDNTKATHLYYIAQEALNNAVRHSGANEVVISLSEQAASIVLIIKDNGQGIREDLQSEGIGLQIMPYRARMIGANLQIESIRGNGTTIRASIKKARLSGKESLMLHMRKNAADGHQAQGAFHPRASDLLPGHE